jgi:ATP-dependent Zn protease
VLGEGNMTTAGGADLDNVNNIAREMVYRCGFSKRLGPVALMDTEEVFIGRGRTRAVANIGSELAAIALTDIEEVRRN